MGVFRQFPYSNFHEMNMDEIIKIVKTMHEEWNTTKEQWASYKEYIDNYFSTLDLSEETYNAILRMIENGIFNETVDPVIINEVENWLNENITDGIVVDRSLSISGAAADAKVTGDELKLKTNIPLDEYGHPDNGTDGQILRTRGNGHTEWVNVGQPTDEQTEQAVSDWLNDHPEATTTVLDGSLTIEKFALGTLDYVTPSMFNAIIEGECDITAFQNMVDYAILHNLDIKLDSDFEFNFIPGSTIDDPTRILIKECSGMIFDGNGHTVTMKGLTTTYLHSIDDEASSGRDIFTFLSFVLCDNIIVKNININGEYSYEDGVSFRYQSPRAKGVGFLGCYYSAVTNSNFNGILGNGINFTEAYLSRDGMWRNCENCIVDSCYVSNSLENGFDNMGATAHIVYTNVTCYKCAAGGIETGVGSAMINNSYFEKCKSAFTLGGSDEVSDVYVKNCGLYLNNENSELLISNSRFVLNGMFYMIPNSKVSLVNCDITISSDTWEGQYPISIYNVGTATKNQGTLKMSNCHIDIGTYYINTNYLDSLIISGCKIIASSGNVILNYNTPYFIMVGTLYHGGVVGTITNDNIRITP